MTSARAWHGLNAVVTIFALLLQVVLTATGNAVPFDGPVAPDRSIPGDLLNLVSYFTIESNVLVAVVAVMLVVRPDRDGPGFRVVRLMALIGITATLVVYMVSLRPIAEETFDGWGLFNDKLLHNVSPLIAIVGWLVFGPRPRVALRPWLLSLLFPVAFLVYTLLRGPIAHWYPYPFLDVTTKGYGTVLLNALVVAVLFLGVGAVYWLLDRALPVAPRAATP